MKTLLTMTVRTRTTARTKKRLPHPPSSSSMHVGKLKQLALSMARRLSSPSADLAAKAVSEAGGFGLGVDSSKGTAASTASVSASPPAAAEVPYIGP